jgi:predicted GNAT family acetyltransferase
MEDAAKLIHDRPAHRFRLPLDDGDEAFIDYVNHGAGVLDLQHTVVPEKYRGKGIGSRLIGEVLAHVRDEGFRFLPSCPFVAAYLRDHPEYRTLVG